MNGPDEAPMSRALDSILGVVAPCLGVLTSLQEQIEFTLRIVSLLIGIAVGAVALYRSWRKP